MKKAFALIMTYFLSFGMYAQEATLENKPNLQLKVSRLLFLAAQSGFSENSFLLSAGVQAPRLLNLNYREKNILSANIDYLGIGFRKQYNTRHVRPGIYLNTSLVTKIFESDEESFSLSAVNLSIIDYGVNQFKPDGFLDDMTLHLEISNLTGLSISQSFRRYPVKVTLTPGLKVSNLEKPEFAYIFSVIARINGPWLSFIKADNTSTIEHRLSAGIIYRLR